MNATTAQVSVKHLCISTGCLLSMLLLVSGCATVDPSSDYLRAQEHVAGATGHETLYRPDEAALVKELVEELLTDGLTSAEAVQLALLNNRDLQALLLEIGLGRADAVQAGLFSNPSLQLAIRLPLESGSTNMEGGLLQNVAELWQIPLRKRVAERHLEQAVLQASHEAATLAAKTKDAYFEAITAESSLGAASENVTTSSSFLELTLERLDAGGATQVDVNAARSRSLEQKVAERRAQQDADQAQLRLMVLLGISPSATEVTLAEKLVEPAAEALDVDGLLRSARIRRLDLQAATKQVEAAEIALPLARRRALQALRLGLAFEGEGGQVALGPAIGLQLPIFDQNQTQIAKAEYRYEQAHRELEAVTLRVEQQVRGAYTRFVAANDTLALYRDELLPLREQSLELAQESFSAGKTGFLYVLEAQDRLLLARREYVEQLGALARTIPALEAACGQPVAKLGSSDQ